MSSPFFDTGNESSSEERRATKHFSLAAAASRPLQFSINDETNQAEITYRPASASTRLEATFDVDLSGSGPSNAYQYAVLGPSVGHNPESFAPSLRSNAFLPHDLESANRFDLVASQPSNAHPATLSSDDGGENVASSPSNSFVSTEPEADDHDKILGRQFLNDLDANSLENNQGTFIMLSDLAPLPGDETPTTTTTPESISDGTTSTPESISDGQNHLSPQDVALPAPNTADSRYRELPATTHLEAMPSLDNNQGNFLLPSDFSPLPSGETPTTITPQSISDGENHPAAQDVVLPDPNAADSRYRALPDGTFSCNMCVRVCRRENNIRRHVTHQHPMPGFPVPRYPCDHPGCGKSYAFPGELAAHKRKDHEGKPAQKRKMKAKASDEIYWCNYSDVCRKIFKTVQGIEAHLNKVHNVDVQMSGLLVREMVPTLSGPHDPVPGPSRERNEPNVPPLKRRKMNLKVPDKIYRCKYFPVCKKEYKMWGRFRNHMRNVHMEVVEMAD